MAPVADRLSSLVVRLSRARTEARRDSVLIHPAGGGLLQYLPIATRLAQWGSVTGIRAAGLLPGEEPHRDVDEMASLYADIILKLDSPPALLLGWSMGGVLAWEVSALLAAHGQQPAVVMIDSMHTPPAPARSLTDHPYRSDSFEDLAETVLSHGLGAGKHDPNSVATTRAHVSASMCHQVRTVLDTPALLLACGAEAETSDRLGDWAAVATALRIEGLPGGHFDVFNATVGPLVIDKVDRFLHEIWDDHE